MPFCSIEVGLAYDTTADIKCFASKSRRCWTLQCFCAACLLPKSLARLLPSSRIMKQGVKFTRRSVQESVVQIQQRRFQQQERLKKVRALVGADALRALDIGKLILCCCSLGLGRSSRKCQKQGNSYDQSTVTLRASTSYWSAGRRSNFARLAAFR